MKNYSLPDSLDNDINQLADLIAKFKSGRVSAAELKAHRVPFGVYEQRRRETYMARIRSSAGIITPIQLKQIALIAAEYGIEDLHITTRQELQIHHVKIDDIIPIIRALKDIGLSTRGGGGNTVRNITAQEDAGIDPREAFDVSLFAAALTTRLIAEGDSWTLPRKFKVAFSGSDEDKGYATIADLGFIARLKGGKKGFKVYVAGGLGAKSQVGRLLFEFIESDEVYAVVKAVKNIFWKYGNRKNKHAARLRFLWQSLGEKEFKQRLDTEYALVKKEGFSPLMIEEAQDMALKPGIAAECPVNADDFILWKKRFVQAQKQKDLFSVLIPVRLGFISSIRAGKLGEFLEAFGDDTARMTKEQNFLLRNIPYDYMGNLYNFLKAAFENFNQPPIYGKIVSCAGASTCQLGICLSRQAIGEVFRRLEKSGLDLDKIGRIRLNISGCPNGCGQHQTADLGFFGKAARCLDMIYPAYNVVCGAIIQDGRTKFAETIAEVAARDLPELIIDVLRLYLDKNNAPVDTSAASKPHPSGYGKVKPLGINPEQTPGFSPGCVEWVDFARYLAGGGKEDLSQLCLKYKQIPSFKEDKNYYYDWGTDALFSMAERQAGECSAGLFDLIEMDLNNIKETRSKLTGAGVDEGLKKKLLGELVFYSSRMLLITRGIEPKDAAQAYAAFISHFIDTGLLARDFREVIDIALKQDSSQLLRKEASVYALAEAVVSLYEHMDNAFNFKVEDALRAVGKQDKENPSIEKTAVTTKDLRGVACPMNFVRTKIELSQLNPGDILEVLLDDGAPIENVPGSVKAEGHKVIAQNKTGDYWSLLIEKR